MERKIDSRIEAEKLEAHIFLIRGLLNFHRRSTSGTKLISDPAPQTVLVVSAQDMYESALAHCLELLENEYKSITSDDSI